MKSPSLINICICVLLIISLFVIWIYVVSAAVDLFTIKQLGEESIPCIDKAGRPFQNEMCTRNTTCSWLGLVGTYRCDAQEASK